MDASDIIRLLQTSHYSPADLEEVNKVCRNNPEFTAAHLLKVRIMEVLGYDKQKQLKIAAVYAIDRTKLFQLVTGVVPPTVKAAEPETDAADPASEIIQFSEEPHVNADIIIDQHAPYASQPPDTELLELDEEQAGELLEIRDDDVPADESAAPEQELAAEEQAEPVPEHIDDITFEPADTHDTEKDVGTEEDVDTEEEVGTEEDVDTKEVVGTEEDVDTKEDVGTEEDVDTKEDVDTEEDVDAEEDNDAELLLRDLEKNETEMEEPGQSEEDFPSIDRVDKDRDDNSRNNHLISKFIKEDPGPIRADRETSLKGDVSLDSIREHDGFITDTLARIYVKQGLLAKAIYAYERLSLKYPEKSAYFAAQIEKIKNINHS